MPVTLRRTLAACLLGPGALLTAACGADPQAGGDADRTADLILRGASVLSMAAERPRAEAVAIAGGRIVYVGDDAGVEAFRDSATRVIDLGGATVLPGLTDSHAHLMGTGRLKTQIDLLESTTFQELLDAVAAATERAEPGEWIVGRGWHQEKWTDVPETTVRGFPTHEQLTAVSPDNPVSIRHASGHGRLVNRRALEAADVTADTPDPPGGEILHLPGGDPSGMMLEEAENLVEDAYREWLEGRSAAQRRTDDRRALEAGVEEFLRHGITAVHTPPADSRRGESEAEIALYREAEEAGRLGMRVYAMVNASDATDESLERLRSVPTGDGRLTVRAIKAYADGALGSRGALLLDPYADDDTRGEEVSTEAELRRVAELALRHGYQAAIHAIGDAANRRVLDVYAELFERHPQEAEDARFRIEHVQIVHPDDVARLAELGVVASMQGVHATSDGPWTPTRLGSERTRVRAYPFRDLWDAGVLVVNGTDAPVERVDPWASIAGMAVGRMQGGEVFNPHHLLARHEALATYTVNAARAAFDEARRGTLEVGKLADVTVVDGDPLSIPDDALADLETLMTIVGGEIVYEAAEAADQSPE
jgi:hypothetical protein